MERLVNLERIRHEKCFSRRDLALLSGVSKETIQSLEQGINNVEQVKLATLIKLSKALKCKVSDLLPKELQRYL